jgi:hypothetical protein
VSLSEILSARTNSASATSGEEALSRKQFAMSMPVEGAVFRGGMCTERGEACPVRESE